LHVAVVAAVDDTHAAGASGSAQATFCADCLTTTSDLLHQK
jgi:hypothetical protein